MSLDVILQSAAEGTGLPAEPNLYTGDALEYLTWNYDEIPMLFAEGVPNAARYLTQVHYYLPSGKNPNPIKQQLCQLLFHAGCTWPSITNASDAEGQHYVLECEYVDGGRRYGQL